MTQGEMERANILPPHPGGPTMQYGIMVGGPLNGDVMDVDVTTYKIIDKRDPNSWYSRLTEKLEPGFAATFTYLGVKVPPEEIQRRVLVLGDSPQSLNQWVGILVIDPEFFKEKEWFHEWIKDHDGG
uniref:Uncharacterized protein n=1 Tax=viral metagenome TaxID=1070528 RepID=A0A6M3ISN7_9ZZZZ